MIVVWLLFAISIKLYVVSSRFSTEMHLYLIWIGFLAVMINDFLFSLKPGDIQTIAATPPQNLQVIQWPPNPTCSNLESRLGPQIPGCLCPVATSAFLAAAPGHRRTALLQPDPSLQLIWDLDILTRPPHIWVQVITTTTTPRGWIKIWRQDWEVLK